MSADATVKPRNEYLDFVKGIAIILVELGHSVQWGSGEEFCSSGLFFEDSLFRLIYAFHMPLFMLVSGYVFYWSSGRRTPGKTVRRQFLCVAFPGMCWTLFFQALLFRLSGNWYSLAWLRELPAVLLGGNWFCWAVFWCSMLTIAVLTWERQVPPPRTLRVLALFFASVLLPLLPNHFLQNGYMYVFMYPYFALGYAANYYDLPARMGKALHGACFAVSLALFALLFPLFHYSAYVYTSMTCVLSVPDPFHQFLIDGYRWVIGLVGSATVLYILYGLWKATPGKLRQMVLWLGKRTLALYILSPYLGNYVLAPLSAPWPPSYWLNMLEAAVMLAVSALVIYLLEGWRWTRRAFLGRWDG